MTSHIRWILLLLCCALAAPARAEEPALTKLSLSVRGTACSALLLRPSDARALLVLAHGQVMNIHHPFMESVSAALARQGIATLRFNFPYAEAKRERPDPQPLLLEAILAAVREAEQRRGSLLLLLGGKSIGAILAAVALQGDALPGVSGLVVLGYPLHAPGRPSALNARALDGVKRPLLVVQGTRDSMADLTLMKALIEGIGPQARLVTIADADHGFELPEGSTRTEQQVHDELAGAVASFVAKLAQPAGR